MTPPRSGGTTHIIMYAAILACIIFVCACLPTPRMDPPLNCTNGCWLGGFSYLAVVERQPSRWTNPHSLPSFLYADVTQNPARLLQFMHTVADVGVCLLKDGEWGLGCVACSQS